MFPVGESSLTGGPASNPANGSSSSATYLYVHPRFGGVPRTTLQESLDDFFITTMGITIFLMQAGFAFLEAGSVRSKNTVNILMKNLLNFLIGGVAFWSIGFPLAFGDGNAFMGWTHWLVYQMDKDDIVLCWFDFMHATTAASIASGAVAGRCHRYAHAVFSLMLTGFTYPIAMHWVWHPDGWLRNSSYQAYAGAGIVHVLGSVTALVGASLMGPRIGKFDKETGQPTNDIRGHSVPLTAFGGFVLIFGFMALAAGYQGHISQPGDGSVIALAVVNSLLGACSGGIGCLFVERYFAKSGTWSFLITLNGSLAGLVAVSGGCNVFEPWASMVCGAIGGWTFLLLHFILIKCKVDDPVGSIPTHLAPVVWGNMAVGLLQDGGLFFEQSREKNLGVLKWNFIGLLAIAGWALATSLLVFGILKALKILRTPEYKEKGGLDYWNHRESAYPLVSWIEGDMPATHAATFVRNCTMLLDYAQATAPQVHISAENLPAMVILDAVSQISDDSNSTKTAERHARMIEEMSGFRRPRACSVPTAPPSKFFESRRVGRQEEAIDVSSNDGRSLGLGGLSVSPYPSRAPSGRTTPYGGASRQLTPIMSRQNTVASDLDNHGSDGDDAEIEQVVVSKVHVE